MRRMFRWLLYALGVLLLVLVGTVAFLQTGSGKRLLASQLSSLLSTPDAGIEIAGIEGSIPLDMEIGAVRLADREGIWLKADGVTFDWSPSALLGGRIRVDEIGAARVELVRPPISEEAPEPVSDKPFRLPELPKSLLPITVDRLAVPEILLGAPVLGEAASFALEGSVQANDGGDAVTADLDLKRTDQATAFISLDATVSLDPPSLDLDLKGNESGGMTARLAGRPDMGDVDLSLDGRGPLDAWSGRLRAEAGGLALVEADLGLALVEQPRFTVDGALKPSPGMLPEDIAGLVGDALSIDLDVVQTKAQALDLQKIAIDTDVATLDAKGTVDFDGGDVALQTTLAVPDLAPLGTLAKAGLAGEATATLDVAGTLDAPDGQLNLRVNGPAFDDRSAASITTDVRWTTASPLSSDRPAFDVVIDGRASELSIPGTVLPDPNVTWSAALEAPLEGEIGIERMAIETAESTLSATGAIDPVKLEGAVDLALSAPSLQRLAEPYGQSLDGKALIEAAIRLKDQASDIAVDLDAGLDELSGLPPGAAELFGEQARLKARVTLDPSNRLDLETLTLDGAEIDVDGQANLQLDQDDLAGRITLALPNLAVLEPLMPNGAAGAIELEADLGGSLEAPSADLRLTSRDLVLAGEPIAKLGITMAGRDLIASPSGDLKVDVTARKTPATLALDYRLADGTLHLDAIDLTAPETEIGGALEVALETTLVDGGLEGRIADLGTLEALIQQPLEGSVDLDLKLSPDGARQNVKAVVQGQEISGDFGRLKTIDLDASIIDATTRPRLDAKASLTGFEQGANTIDALTLAAKGNADDLDFKLDIAGEAIKPLELAAAGSLAFKDGLALGLERLEGTFAGEPLRLARPLTFRQNGDDIELADLDLRLGDASLSGDVDIGKTTARGAIDLRSLPLSWSEVFGGPSMSGSAAADIDLSGNVSNPKVIAALDVDGLLAEDVAPGDLPLDISLNARIDQGRLIADLTGTGLTKKPITANASLPVRLKLNPFAFDMPEDGALDGRINAELLLARLADLLALDDQTLKGTLLADIAIGGTLGEPNVKGPIALQGGAYENGATGTDLRDLILKATASNERVDVTELSASTGKKGLITSNAWLELDANAEFPLFLSLSLEQAQLVDRDDVEARISGDIAMSGNLGQAEVKGDLTVDRAEISIPDGGGPSLPDIEVTEVGGRIVNPEEEETTDAGEKPFDPALNLRIRLPQKIYVRGRGLESEWQGDLRISGPASDPIVVGSLNIKKGYFDFLDKRFELELGEITFSGETPPNPIIALEAVSEDDDFTAIIKLNGPANDPQLLLSSEPVLPEDEILARLLFNRELSQIGPVEAAKLALAVNRLRGGGGFDAFGEIRGILKIDTLDVVSDDEGETAVKAGKYLNDDVYVEVEKGAGDESGRARVEIELLPNIALEADTSEDANSGVGLKWKFNY